MSQWSHAHPEEMAEIAALPQSQQLDALRNAVDFDPDRIREEREEALRTVCAECGAHYGSARDIPECPLCGAVEDGE